MKFEFVYDPGHAWLIVTVEQFARVGLKESDITPYSYRRGNEIGLEEDCDAMTYLNAHKATFGEMPPISEKPGSCRGWSNFGTKARAFA